MGRDIDTTAFTREDRRRYRDKVKTNLRVLRELMDEGRFATGQRTMGVELEINLTDERGHALPVNQAVLTDLASPDFSTELAQFNLEFDIEPRELVGRVLRHVEDELRASLEHASTKAAAHGARIVMIGILPTLTDFDITEQNLSANPRYKALNDAILAARGEDITIHIEGDAEELEVTANSIVFEAACTSMQLHLQVDPDAFARYWNAAQVVSGPLVAVASNSPFFLGKQLHHETRIALFEQATDTRTEELVSQGVRPRVWFGERWLSDGVLELFDENVRYFPSLLPITYDTDPDAEKAAGDIPHLDELTLHNGTIYRWNRPVYDIARGRPHLRVENRVLPAGPTVLDACANMAFYYGLLSHLADHDPPVAEWMAFEDAEHNFFAAARQGLDARLQWPGTDGPAVAAELVADVLVPAADRGLERWDVDADDRARYLGIIEARARSRQNGAAWQLRQLSALLDQGLGRAAATAQLTRTYADYSERGQPVHTWPVG